MKRKGKSGTNAGRPARGGGRSTPASRLPVGEELEGLPLATRLKVRREKDRRIREQREADPRAPDVAEEGSAGPAVREKYLADVHAKLETERPARVRGGQASNRGARVIRDFVFTRVKAAYLDAGGEHGIRLQDIVDAVRSGRTLLHWYGDHRYELFADGSRFHQRYYDTDPGSDDDGNEEPDRSVTRSALAGYFRRARKDASEKS